MYEKLCSYENLLCAFKSARKGKTKKRYVKRFEKNLEENLSNLQAELLSETYKPHKLKHFIISDPKTRKISKSAFKDRIVHHALCNILVPICSKSFIYDSHANQIGKGTHKALERFDTFKRKVAQNGTKKCYVLKADIKHYFEEIDHNVLLSIIQRKIQDTKIISLIELILSNYFSSSKINKGMPLGNLTSQFFANLYLNELDQLVKHTLKAQYYIRYVDDFVILHKNPKQLAVWKKRIDNFLKEKLHIRLHPDKSQIVPLDKGATFLGFRIFYHFRLLRKSNMHHFERKLKRTKILFCQDIIDREKAVESLEGWLAYARHSNTYKYRTSIIRSFNASFPTHKQKSITNIKKHQNFMRKVDISTLQYSIQKTLFLYCSGLSIPDIAQKRNIKESTVWEHIAKLIYHNHVSVWQVLEKRKIHKIAHNIKSRKDRLKDIRRRIKDNSITYNDINCVLLSIKSKDKI